LQQYSDGDPLMGASNAGTVCKIATFEQQRAVG